MRRRRKESRGTYHLFTSLIYSLTNGRTIAFFVLLGITLSCWFGHWWSSSFGWGPTLYSELYITSDISRSVAIAISAPSTKHGWSYLDSVRTSRPHPEAKKSIYKMRPLISPLGHTEQMSKKISWHMIWSCFFKMTKFFGLRGRKLQNAVGAVSLLAILTFGYNQSVVGGLLTTDSFNRQFPTINTVDTTGEEEHRHSTIQGWWPDLVDWKERGVRW